MIGISETQDKVRVVRSYRLANEAKRFHLREDLKYLGFRSAGEENNKCANLVKFIYVKVVNRGNPNQN